MWNTKNRFRLASWFQVKNKMISGNSFCETAQKFINNFPKFYFRLKKRITYKNGKDISVTFSAFLKITFLYSFTHTKKNATKYELELGTVLERRWTFVLNPGGGSMRLLGLFPRKDHIPREGNLMLEFDLICLPTFLKTFLVGLCFILSTPLCVYEL